MRFASRDNNMSDIFASAIVWVTILAQANTWTELSPTGGPPTVRHLHTAVWSDADDGFYVFGGEIGRGSIAKPNEALG